MSGAPKEASGGGAPEKVQQRLSVVVEDSVPNRRIVVTLLEKLGFKVYESNNGKDGFELLNNCIKNNETPHLIISDVMMPEMDGFQLLQKVRTTDKLSNIPFLIVTALANKADITKALELKASGYIIKPIIADQLISKIVSIFPDLSSQAKKMMQAA